jgi:Tol biopolymer transport system component
MTLPSGALLGPYEILSLIGAGGMGEVYKGRDTRLNRAVAIKLLPIDVAERADRRARFDVEARAISSLSHPHICALFDVGEQDGRPFLVMEHLDGETLDDRLMRGALPANEVVRYAVQMADALAHAHRERIVHRDLKPSNVMLTASGAKLLDFGLARRPAAEPTAATMSTLSFDERKLTAEGTIIGTFQYMAPEQLEGKEADARTDIFAFGTLLYEMATGRKAFEGKSQASLIASILTAQPPAISSAREGGGLPPALDHVVERCLAKNPDDRWQTARDLKLELDWLASGSGSGARLARTAPAHSGRRLLTWVAAAAVVVASIAFAVAAQGRFRQSSNTGVTRFVVAPPPGSLISGGEQRTRLAISPDGRQIAFAAVTDGRLQIWVRALDTLAAQPVAGTEGGVSPFWSPDGKYLGFFAPDRAEIKKVALAGGPSRTICAAQSETPPEWGTDGTILFSVFRDGIFRVSAEGGTPARLTALDKTQRELNHFWPSFLPDGKHFIYLVTANDSDVSKAPPSVYVAPLDGGKRTLLPRIHSRTMYAAPGYLLFVEEGALLAQAFDLGGLRVTGEAAQVASGVASFRTIGSASFTVSSTGTLAYLGSGDEYQMVWYDRRGNQTDTGWARQTYGSARISPDGQRAVVDVYDPRNGESDLWIYDLARNVPARFTSDRPSDRNGVWSPDASRILFTTERGGSPNLFTKAFEGTGDIVPLVRHPGPIFSDDWSSDNRWVAYTVNSVSTAHDIWMKPLGGDARERPFLASQFEESGGRFSPDAKWVAFVSDETNSTSEVYVAPVDQPGQRRQISIGGGTTPRWRRDGKEMFYVSLDNISIMSVEIESLIPFKVGKPTRLIAVGQIPMARDNFRGTVYDVTPDGQRFLVSLPYGEPASSRITVVLNWAAGLKQ